MFAVFRYHDFSTPRTEKTSLLVVYGVRADQTAHSSSPIRAFVVATCTSIHIYTLTTFCSGERGGLGSSPTRVKKFDTINSSVTLRYFRYDTKIDLGVTPRFYKVGPKNIAYDNQGVSLKESRQ